MINYQLSNNYETYRASRELATCEMGLSSARVHKIQQQKLRENPEQIRQAFIDVIDNCDYTNLGLIWGETKALCAVQYLLDSTDYQGHSSSPEVKTSLGILKCPILYVTITDYLDAYELQKNDKNLFNRRQRDLAISSLESLQKKRKVYFEKSYWQTKKGKKGEWIKTIVETYSSLISLQKLSSQKQTLGVDNQRCKYLKISISPLLFYRIDNDYLEKPKGLFRAIEAAVNNKSKKASKVCYNFILMLLQGDLKEYCISRQELIRKLDLGSRLKARQQSLIDSTISGAIAVATELKFLNSYHYNSEEKLYFFYPSEQRCSRLRRKNQKSLLSDLKPSELMEVQDAWELTESFINFV